MGIKKYLEITTFLHTFLNAIQCTLIALSSAKAFPNFLGTPCHPCRACTQQEQFLCRFFSSYSPENLVDGTGPTLRSSKVETGLPNENSYWFICLGFYFSIGISFYFLTGALGKHKRNVSSAKCN